MRDGSIGKFLESVVISGAQIMYIIYLAANYIYS
jgi:hypothetical protein